MASSNFLRWGTAVLLSALAGCSSSDNKTATCPNPANIICNTPTGAQCFDQTLDSNNCGWCGNICGAGTTCQAGACVAAMPAPVCAVACTGGKTCQVGGVCACAAGSQDCGGVCANLATEAANCGACANACPVTAPMCNTGLCSSSCTAGLTACGTSCVDVHTNAANCGSCGVVCPVGNTCVADVCKAPVVTGTGGATGVGGGPGTGGATVGQTGATTVGGATTTGGATGTGGTKTSTGGTTATGGSKATGGTTATGSSLPTGTRPPGYYYTADWAVPTSKVDWHGCVWTGIDSTVTGSTTTITSPTSKDYTSGVADGGPYRVAGTVHNAYASVAMVGFNLSEAITGSSTQCAYNAAASTAAGPPAVTMPSAATGIAVNWSATKAPPTSFRIQIQAADGATNGAHRWCATITDAGGPSFIPFTSFYTNCWNVGVTPAPATDIPVAYAKEAISAMVFLVPGTVANTAPFDITIVGFAPGTSKDDAPGGAAACGTTTGTLGSATASTAASMQRAKVSGTDCKQYIAFNNNWGNPTGSTQLISFTGNSFTVQSSSGSGSSAPASFPSLYIGANGDIAGGTYSTWSDSGLPKLISAISSVQTSFAWSGGTGGKNFNAAYDVWFSKSQPTAGGYNDAISGFLMVWLYKPANYVPIGSIKRTATIAGHTWNVWVGQRGNTSTGTDAATRPVVSYVAQDSPVASLSFDLKAFISDAVTNGAADMTAGQTLHAFANSWYLTDVFAGFEIWQGGDGKDLKETFTCVVK